MPPYGGGQSKKKWPIKVSMPYVVISLSQTNICEWLWLGVDVRMQTKKTRVLKTSN